MYAKPPLKIQTTTLWEYPSQDYGTTPHGNKDYIGATPAWIIWNLLQRYTRENDIILDPMCGSGTSIDVAKELKRNPLGFDLVPSRPDIKPNDARKLPLKSDSVDFAFIDPPYSTHVDYSDDPRCIGKLSAAVEPNATPTSKGKPGHKAKNPAGEMGEEMGGGVNAYYQAMEQVIGELFRVLKDRRYLALYVSDSFKKGHPFMPIGFELFQLLQKRFKPIDIITVVRHNRTLQRNHWHTSAIEGNYYLRGFNYLFIMKKELASTPPGK